jgi:hypothetical protein
MWRARLARSRRAGGSMIMMLPRGTALRQLSWGRARTARDVIVLRDRGAPAAAFDAAVRRCPQPARLGRATAECGRHMACLSRAIATRRRRHSVPPCGAALRQLGWGEQLQGADDTGRARLARSQRVRGGIRCCLAVLPSASAARESDCGARTAHGLLVSGDRNTPAAALDAAYWRCPPPSRPGRATAVCGRHVPCSSRATATRRRRHLVLPCNAALRQRGWGG